MADAERDGDLPLEGGGVGGGDREEGEEGEYGETTFYRAKLYRDSPMPEVAILAAWVVVMKMVYGLDDEQRYVFRHAPFFEESR